MATDAARWGRAKSRAESEQDRSAEKQDQPVIQRAWEEPRGLWGALTTVSSVRNGQRLIAVAFFFLLLGGFNAAFIRFQLIQPNNTLVTPEQYNELFTMHGSTMLFLFVVPFMEGAALMLLPLVLGARGVPWPRLTAFIFWTFTIGGLLLESSWLFGTVPNAGWTAYAPLAEKAFSPNAGQDFWLLALMMISVGGILVSALLITTVLKFRAPGMSMRRMPLYAWAVLTVSAVMFLAFIVIFCAGVLMESDRKLGTHFFDFDGGGNPVLWQYLFWIFGNPLVYIQLIPAVGLISLMLPALVRQRVTGYRFLAAAFVVSGLLTFGLWVDHLSVSGLPWQALMIFTVIAMLAVILGAVQVSAWLTTIWHGAGKWNTAYLFVLGFLFLTILGGVTGAMLSLVPFDAQVHGSFFVVAHLHYFLFGTAVFPLFAAFYYWLPKFKGKFLDERLGQWNFWLMFAGFNIAFFPMFISGLFGMPRRLYTYPSIPELDTLNLISTVGAVILVTGILIFLVNLFMSLLRGENAPDNPWQADSLEWGTPSPVPAYGFHHIPIVQSRNPLWDQERIDAGAEKMTALVERLAEWPNTWRAALVTSTFEGEPEQVHGVAGPSIWPLVAVIGMTLLFVSFLFEQLVFLALALVGALVLIVGLVGWHKPAKEEPFAAPAELDEFEKSYGVGIYPRASAAIHSWGVLLAILGSAIALAVVVFCYLFYRSNSPFWPPDGVARPDRSLPLIATAVLVASELVLLFGSRTAQGVRNSTHRLVLGGSFLLGVVFLVLQVRSYVLLPLTPATNAYGSIFYGVGLFMTLITLIGLAIMLGTEWSIWRGGSERRVGYLVRDTALYWSFVVVAWLVTLATLYLTL